MQKILLLRIFAAAVWIGLSEFARNQIILRSYWILHYSKLGVPFPESPQNGAVWGIWSILFAFGIAALSRRFTWIQTTLLAWWFGFIMMWVVIGNLNVLPLGILPIAIPLSLLESTGAAWVLRSTVVQEAA